MVGWLLFAEKQWFTKRLFGLVWYLHIPQGPTNSSPRSAEIAMQSISCFPSDTAFNRTKNRYFYEAGNAGSACYGNTHFCINQIINQSSNSRTFHPPLKIVKTTSSLEKMESIFTLFYIITIPLK